MLTRSLKTGIMVSLALHALALPALYYGLAHTTSAPREIVLDNISVRFIPDELIQQASRGNAPTPPEPVSPKPAEPVPETSSLPVPPVATTPPPPQPERVPEPPQPKPQPTPMVSTPEPKVAEVSKSEPLIPLPAAFNPIATNHAGPTTNLAQESPAQLALSRPSSSQVSTGAMAKAGVPTGLINARPRYKFSPEPAYPAMARRRRQEGLVTLRVSVTAGGKPEKVEIQKGSGFPALDQAALSAVQGWDFDPGQLDGKPVPSTVEVPVRFQLDK